MRLVAGLLALTLTGTFAYADEAKAPEPQPAPVATARSKVSLRVVKLMPESHQALLFDKNRGTHVLADVGSVIGTYTVMEIDEDEVTLSSAGRVVILPAPEPTTAPAPAAIPATKAPAADITATAPTNPYALPPVVPGGPDDPYAPDDGAVRPAPAPKPVVAAPEAPADPYWVADPTAPAPAPKHVAAAPEAPADPYADAEPSPAPAPKRAAAESAVRIAAVPSSVPMTSPYDDEAALDAALTAGAGSVRAAPDAITVTEMEVDPYGEPAPAAAPTTMNADPYAEPMVAAPAPIEPAPAAKPAKAKPAKDNGAQAFADAMNGQVIVKVDGETLAPTPAPAPAKVARSEPATMLSRSEVNNALSDFGVLTASVRGAFTPEGARIDTVAQGSVFAKAGLRGGDVITAVDGRPLTSIDDAADLYIRAGSARTAKVQLLRAGKPMTLRLAIQ